MLRFWLALMSILILSISLINAQENANGIVYAQEPYQQRPSYGLFFDLNYNMHSANFTGGEWESSADCCPQYDNGSGIGYAIGVFYGIPVMADWDLNLRLAYNNLSALLSAEEPQTVSGANGVPVNGLITHEIDASLSSIGIMPLLTFHTTDQLNIHLGFRAGLMMQHTYSQKEEISEPSNGRYDDTGLRTRHVVDNQEITNASSIDFAGVAGVSYMMPLGASFEWFLEPEVYYNIGLMPIASGLSWTANAITGGIALRYMPREVIPEIIPPKESPLPPLPPPPLPPKFNAFITAVSVNEDGTESEVSQIKVEEFLSRRIHPLLNYVFFDQGSNEIPKRYSRMNEQEKAEFSPNYLANLKTMDVYYQVLNIVGNRMKRFPNTTINLIGCYSNETSGGSNVTEAAKRAQTIKEFLNREWGIDNDRIKTDTKKLPDVPANKTEVIEENRRVEMKTEFNDILFEPVAVRDTIRNTNPPLLRFKPTISSEVGVKSWKVVTYQGDVLLKKFEGTGMPSRVLELNLQEEQEYVPILDEPFRYKLVVIDNANQTWESEVKSMQVQANTIQTIYERLADGEEVDASEYDQFSLISFGFNQAELTDEHQPIIKLAKQRILENSKVKIEGKTDNTGDANRNLKLSKERADVTADALGVDRKFAKGLGMANPSYSNDLPEGRFYNRTVYIAIETKIEGF